MEAVILLVSDDELMGVERIREALFKSGFRILPCLTGQACLAPTHPKPELIVVNLNELESGGSELCQLLRNKYPQTPILVIGAGNDEDLQVRLLEQTADGYMSRPVKPGELVARIRSILRRTRSHQDLNPDTPETVPAKPDLVHAINNQDPAAIRNRIHDANKDCSD